MKYLLILAILLSSAAPACAARDNTTTANGKGVVVHSRKGPVAVHRALPPYGVGKHVYGGR